MSRATRRRATRGGGAARREAGGRAKPVRILAASVAAALLVVAVVWQVSQGSLGHHPSPRPDAHAAHVAPAERYEGSGYVEQAYAMAAEIPEVLDGLFCYCYCATSVGHHSLLDCFRDDHAATCGVCLDEAVTAYEMTRQGASLDDVRAEIDRRYRA